jgi:hypothetical protein
MRGRVMARHYASDVVTTLVYLLTCIPYGGIVST